MITELLTLVHHLLRDAIPLRSSSQLSLVRNANAPVDAQPSLLLQLEKLPQRILNARTEAAVVRLFLEEMARTQPINRLHLFAD